MFATNLGGTSLLANVVRFLNPITGVLGLTASAAEFVAPRPGALRNLTVETGSTQPSGIGQGPLTLIMVVNGVDTALKVTLIPGTAAGVYWDNAHSIDIAQGQKFYLKISNGGLASAQIKAISWCI